MKKIIIALLLITLTGCNNKRNPDEVEVDYNKISETKLVDGIEISNINIKIMDGVSEISYSLKNKESSEKTIKEIELIFKNKKKEEITRFTVEVGSKIKSGEEKAMRNVIDVDLTKASEYEVIVR